MTEETAKKVKDLYDLKSKYSENLSFLYNSEHIISLNYRKILTMSDCWTVYPNKINNFDSINEELKNFLINIFKKKLAEVDLEIQNIKC